MVLLIGDEVSQYRNMDSFFTEGLTQKRKDSICLLKSGIWKANGQFYEIEYYEGMFLQFMYGTSLELKRLQHESKELIKSFNQEIKENQGLIPVILWDDKKDVLVATNVNKSKEALIELKDQWKIKNSPIVLILIQGKRYFIIQIAEN